MYPFLSIGIGAALGAWLRFWLGLKMNEIFPVIPLGTLAANLIGGFLMGIFMTITKDHVLFSPAIRMAVATGFLGGLTTFSTFSAETVYLVSHQQYFWTALIIVSHVAGTIFATILGIYTMKYFTV